jgi:hypothetical protein
VAVAFIKSTGRSIVKVF